MSDQYIGEIRWFTYMRGAPSGWQACDGSLLSISSYSMLYQLLGTTYGGDGNQTFGVPDLRGRTPVHQGSGNGLTPRSIGQMDGTETVTLNIPQMPSHNHVFQANNGTATQTGPGTSYPAAQPDGATFYVPDTTGGAALDPLPQMFGLTGNATPHENCAPSLPILACIATEGQYPVKQN